MMKRTLRIFAAVLAAGLPLVAACAASPDSGGGKTHSHAASNKHIPKPSFVPAHVQTAEYLWTKQESATDPKTYAPYLTWAYPLYGDYASVHGAGIKTVLYVNPLMPHTPGQPDLAAINGPYANVQAKDCSGNPVRSYNSTGYLLDVMQPNASQAVKSVVDQYVRRVTRRNPGNPIDLVFVDNANSFYGVTPMPCNYDSARWTAGVNQALGSIPYPVVINTLSVREKNVPGKVAGLRGGNIAGGMFENCFNGRLWKSEQIAQLQAVALLKQQHKKPGPGFWCYLNGTQADASTVTDRRLFAYTSFLLTYDPAYSVFQESFSSKPSDFRVMPETQFVPLGPLTTPDDADDLKTQNGVYVREFQYCYYRRSLIGACEIAVNPGTSDASIPNLHDYKHSASLSGAGVLDGGQMNFNSPAPSTLGAQNGAILVP